VLANKVAPMIWPLIRTCLVITLLTTTFNLGRISVEFSGAGSDWTVVILSIVVLITSLIGLAAGELVRDRKLDRPLSSSAGSGSV
jgi:hypothetical protein